MGLELKLLPMTFLSEDYAFSYEILIVNSCSDFFDEILGLPALSVPSHFNTYLGEIEDPEERTGNTQTDAYDDPLRYVLVRDLTQLAEHEGVVMFGNKPVWAYLGALPPDKRIALYWY